MNTKLNVKGYLNVGDNHQLYYWTQGNPNGKPVLYIHGGPGSGTDEGCLKYFDLETTWIILLDQRGCGKSKTNDIFYENNTDKLVSDFEILRQKLNIKNWTLFGGSWGSALALVYAIKHPQVVDKIFLRALFLAREKDWSEALMGLGKMFYPYEHQRFMDSIPKAYQNSYEQIVNYCYDQFQNGDESTKEKLAKAWVDWESTLLSPINKIHSTATDFKLVEKLALLECHYAVNKSFLDENFILDNISVLKNKSIYLAHGRFDLICPLYQPLALKQAFPELQLYVTNNAGHSGSDANNLATIKHLLKTYL
ncbi:prolyl aminopeptidase [Mycoplasmoides genitalium]|uniref:Putative proline iminopeptidase n=2 Tax=Mycoplasmoides genitalium TaxID=2097 RepID=PIP_MYCGE|nr:prolyl aminopeptidase [Mycoplasmoides genitalium]P47266.1 RecName: Full=Putative proline iminopeptidase; Short=PIP; AltName: Full=Prolyl aminopeptidase; Short=PAP [Mycoplasmoides genitalium G37]ABY79695.1 proline iminopeptidase [synthetic Mycoplasma genitalium JCVI-1.0]AAC71236.1 proline iminopeptidase [Mycoplasmoides genitalium G37]AFQ02829.1 proline iminopeptidase [Mycoplasmoides genitalium M2321]AFQ03812.1 proline iminopeptidase [Mycoplasmoides genitalium M6320]